jgi:transposase InsO family protein
VDGPALCRIFNQVIAGASTLPLQLSSDHDPLFQFHRWKANLCILGVSEIKTVPHVPLSHPFVERVIGTVRRELLDHIPFWGGDLERKLRHFRDYYNQGRVHASLNGVIPVCSIDRNAIALDDCHWRSHCRGLYQLPAARDTQFATHRHYKKQNSKILTYEADSCATI